MYAITKCNRRHSHSSAQRQHISDSIANGGMQTYVKQTVHRRAEEEEQEKGKVDIRRHWYLMCARDCCHEHCRRNGEYVSNTDDMMFRAVCIVLRMGSDFVWSIGTTTTSPLVVCVPFARIATTNIRELA